MKFRYIFTILFLCLANSPLRSEIVLSDSAKVSLLTCSPGDELYSIFGHSAIRVADPLNNLDVVFNYGTFDFSDPNFYPNFVKGRLNYILSVSYFDNFRRVYIAEGRWILEQELNIDLAVKQHLLDSLLANYQPQNRYYLYDFFDDNCATRIRDVFVRAIPLPIDFDYSNFAKGKSYRQLLMPYLAHKPWAKLGINLLLGIPADRTAEPWDYMFLPDHLLAAFSHAYLVGGNGRIPFAQPPQQILGGGDYGNGSTWCTPFCAFSAILLSTTLLTYYDFRKRRLSLCYDRILWVAVGLLGLLFTFLWAGTAHKWMVWNLNVLWANPIHLFAVFIVSGEKYRNMARTYVKANLLILLALMLVWPFLPQTLPWVVYPVVMALALRMFCHVRLANK